MAYFRLEEFEEETVDKLMLIVNELKDEEELIVFCYSGGGQCSSRNEIELILKNEALKRKVTFLISYIASYAFSLMYELKNSSQGYKFEFKLGLHAWATLHIPAWKIDYGEGGAPRGQFARFQKEFEDSLEPIQYPFLTPDEQDAFNNGEDVYLTDERLKVIFN